MATRRYKKKSLRKKSLRKTKRKGGVGYSGSWHQYITQGFPANRITHLVNKYLDLHPRDPDAVIEEIVKLYPKVFNIDGKIHPDIQVSSDSVIMNSLKRVDEALKTHLDILEKKNPKTAEQQELEADIKKVLRIQDNPMHTTKSI